VEVFVKRIDAILAGDLHVRADSPLCRTDDYQESQWTKLEFIANLCRENNAPLLVSGDIGHRAAWPCWLLEKFMATFKGVAIVACLGQHDLPAHSLDETWRSGCGVLARAGILFLGATKLHTPARMFIRPSHYGVEPINSVPKGYKTILLTHQMVIEEKEEWPGQIATKGHQLLKKHPEYLFIVSGDNHKPFVVTEEIDTYRVLVNPGSMMRMTAAQATHRPRVYALDTTFQEVEPIYLPIKEGVVDRQHIEVAAQRDSRMVAFIEHVKTDYSTVFDFNENLTMHMEHNKTREGVKEKIWAALGEK